MDNMFLIGDNEQEIEEQDAIDYINDDGDISGIRIQENTIECYHITIDDNGKLSAKPMKTSDMSQFVYRTMRNHWHIFE